MILAHVHGAAVGTGTLVANSVLAYAAVVVAALLLAPAATTRPVTLKAIAAATAAAAVTAMAAHGSVVMALHLGAAALWLGGIAGIVVRWRDEGARRRATAVFAPLAVAAVATVVVTGVANTRVHGSLSLVTGSSAYGRVLLVKILVVAAATVVGWTVGRRLGASVRIAAFEAAAVAVALALGVTLASLPLPVRSLRIATDDRECASWWLGRRLAGASANAGAPSCPSQDDLAGTRAFGAALARHFAGRRIAVTVDASPRAAALAAGIGAAAVQPEAADVVVIGDGWGTAPLTLLRTLALGGNRAVVLPPWLLRPDLLSLPPVRDANGLVLVAAPVDPAGAVSRAYVAALRQRAKTASPSGPGLTAFAAAIHTSVSQPRLYAAARLALLPSYLEHDHGEESPWLAFGGLAPVSGPLM